LHVVPPPSPRVNQSFPFPFFTYGPHHAPSPPPPCKRPPPPKKKTFFTFFVASRIVCLPPSLDWDPFCSRAPFFPSNSAFFNRAPSLPANRIGRFPSWPLFLQTRSVGHPGCVFPLPNSPGFVVFFFFFEKFRDQFSFSVPSPPSVV